VSIVVVEGNISGARFVAVSQLPCRSASILYNIFSALANVNPFLVLSSSSKQS